ncbi:hypothetical protein NLG97_g5397 [Lecanicillium saksenae]|uniref:Uncharacterized protein n=1 Tax=Lecanicillium saksenae TaxID=468837 RepID=A0ACC1QTS1_9HYPO|nr:hypothetical protein NLG97_g5397 [Lecanicillium saksenae]
MKYSYVLAALAGRHEPFSCGKYKFPYQRPSKECRSYAVPEVERVIKDMKKKVHDPDLYRLFLNTWPNTVDTTVLWHGMSAENPEEELAFVITGDINAMWLRDSANQLQSYKPILNDTGVGNDTNTVAALFRENLRDTPLRGEPPSRRLWLRPTASTTPSWPPGSPCELNIDHQLRNNLATRMTKAVGQDVAMIETLEEVTALFEDAQNAVFKLMASDSVPKFLRNAKYEQQLRNFDADLGRAPERSQSRSNRK